MSAIIDNVLRDDPLVTLIQNENFVGWVYGIDYESAYVMTNDVWKLNVNGIPHNCFLTAAAFDPQKYSETQSIDREVILLRVVESARLPQDDDLVRTKIDHFQDQEGTFETGGNFDDLTLNQVQFGGLKCRILGTFYTHDNKLWLGSDIESFSLASKLRVYRPSRAALELIVNHVDPIREQAMIKDAQDLGLQKIVEPIQIGTLRYTSTDRLHRKISSDLVKVQLHPSDFLARRTAVLGMTRTGKSNMIKQTVAMVKRVSKSSGLPIGQIIFDINGEYANANQQDKGSIADVYSKDTIRYRGKETKDFEDLRHNFYVNLTQGLGLLQNLLKQDPFTQTDLETFKSASLEKPDITSQSEYKRWEVKKAIYQCLLAKAQFTPPSKFTIKFPAGKGVREQIKKTLEMDLPEDPSNGLSIEKATEWFENARAADVELRRHKQFLKSSSGNEWFDAEALAFVNLLARKNDRDVTIRGFRALFPFRDYHSPQRSKELLDEIYNHLENGKIVILDLSIGPPNIREEMSTRIADALFQKSMSKFVSGKRPPHIVAYVEEAHNLIGRKQEITDTWPRLAKEGAKYLIALVYATQEPSSVHPNILSNTENWFVTHLNNEGELREISKFYDFSDFSKSLLRAQDVGFARVKTLSGPFVIPTQIDLFDANAEKSREEGNISNPMDLFKE